MPVTFSRNCITLLLIAIQIQWRWPYFSFQLYNTDLINGGHLTSDYNCTMQIQWRVGAKELQVTIWSRSKPVTSRCEGQLHHFLEVFCTCTPVLVLVVVQVLYTCALTLVQRHLSKCISLATLSNVKTLLWLLFLPSCNLLSFQEST